MVKAISIDLWCLSCSLHESIVLMGRGSYIQYITVKLCKNLDKILTSVLKLYPKNDMESTQFEYICILFNTT